MTILNCFSGEDYFIKRGFLRSKLIVVPNCFDTISLSTSEVCSKTGRNIITVGRFVEQKDYFTALQVIKRVRKSYPDVRYYIIGHGALELAIRNKIKTEGLESSVELAVNPPNIGEFLNKADIYLSTSLFEGTSNSIMEAMNANLPIIATNVGDNPKLVVHGENGFITEVRDIDAITNGIMKLIAENDLRQQMGLLSKHRLRSNYSMEAFRKNYENLIESNK